MKFILINPPCDKILDDKLEPPLGLLYIQSSLIRQGIDCTLYDCAISGVELSKIPIGDYYGFTTYTNNYDITLRISRDLKKLHPNSIHVAGGHHVSAMPDEVKHDWDYIVVGEGETGILSVINYHNIFDKKGHVVYSRGLSEKELNSLPLPIYTHEMLDAYNRRVNKEYVVSMVCGRGCPYNCAFCNSSINKMYKVRKRSLDNILGEITIHKNNGIRNIKFNDDNFLEQFPNAQKLCETMSNMGVGYRIMSGAKTFNKANCKMLFDTGCSYASIGIESMSDQMLKAMRKPSSRSINRTAIINAKEAGLKLRIFLIVGFPGETDDTVNETITELTDLPFDDFGVYPFVPYPGTDVWNNPQKYNARIDKDFNKYVSVDKNEKGGFVLETNTFSRQDVERWHNELKNALTYKHSWSKS